MDDNANVPSEFLASGHLASAIRQLGVDLIGSSIGAYHITALLGAGGMGEVYRARDTTLGRDVAIKILPRLFISDPERLARFEREARVLASLNHPHIGAIYGLEDVDGVRALVLEFVEGETLALKVAEGRPLRVTDALMIARQIADALDAAHEKGIIHRDLKPANIIIAPDGNVKVVDFGIAKASPSEIAADVAPTMTSTEAGLVLGTAAYMSPEQARGKSVDKRTDIWAFGCVVYEMLTGRPAFGGETISDTLASVLERDPDFSALPSTIPPTIVRLVQRCLEKNLKRRVRDIGDAIAELDASPVSLAAVNPPARRVWMWPAFAIGCAAVMAAVLWVSRPRPAVAPVPSLFMLSLDQLEGGGESSLPIPSPDGRYLAFIGRTAGGPASVWLRALDSLEARPLPGTDGGSSLVWSPDSRWIGFYADGKVKKISPSGGAPQAIAEVPGFQDAAWGSHGDLIFQRSNRSPLYKIHESGGTVEQLTTLDKSLAENVHRAPIFLPDGSTFLFTSRSGERQNNALYISSLESRTVKRLMPIQSTVRYIRSGNPKQGTILYYRDGGIVAQHLNLDKHELVGDAVPVVENVEYAAAALTVFFRTSNDGRVAVFRRAGAGRSRLTWFDRSGEPAGTLGEPGEYLQPRLSPDGTRVAFTRPDAQTGNRDVWIIEIARNVAARLTTHGANDWFPVWSADGRRLLFGSDRLGGTAMRPMLKKTLDASGEESEFSSLDQEPYDWSRDGRWIAGQFGDILIASATGQAMPFAFLATPFYEGSPRFSPDGKWVAYVSNETGRYEVYVRPFSGRPAGTEGKIQISTSGGDFPVWHPDGRELYYMSADFTLYGVNTTALARTATVPLPSRLFRVCPGTVALTPPMRGTAFGYNYDTHDGKRFLVNCAVEPPGRVAVLLNWPLDPY